MLFSATITTLNDQLNSHYAQIKELEEKLQSLREDAKVIENYRQSFLSVQKAAESAIEQAAKAGKLIKQAASTNELNEFKEALLEAVDGEKEKCYFPLQSPHLTTN